MADVTRNISLSECDNIFVADQLHSGVLPTQSLSFDQSTGWIVVRGPAGDQGQKTTPLCWLPIDLRGDVFDAHESLFVIASRSNYQLTIIDFKPMLTMLRQLEVIA
jgi:hypothetical protein